MMRRAASGAWVVEQRGAASAPPPEDLAAPDILVIGRRSQDVDIRRRENDVQPYQVATGEQVVRSHRDNLDQFFRSRVTPNTEILPPSLLRNGQTNSEINLRGLGADQTLILVDGRRLPGIPQTNLGLGQPDINAIPLHAIERVETLTGTAGGIYGFGALGGVVNVVLRHDYHGLELHATTGISTRGDTRRLNLEGGVGFTPDDGRTDVMVYVSHSWEQPLRAGQRGLTLRGRQAGNRLDPERFLLFPSSSDSPFVAATGGEELVFKPEYGGAALGANHSFLPKGFAGTQTDLIASLIQHAGQVDIDPSDNEKAGGLTSTPRTSSAIINIRHRLGGGIEAYLDALILRNQGRSHNFQSNGEVIFLPDSPINPFQNAVTVDFAAPPQDQYARIHHSSERYTAGLIVPLPFEWRATAEVAFGAVHYDSSTGNNGFFIGPIIADGSESPDFNPFGNADAFRRSLVVYQHNSAQTLHEHNRDHEQSLRLAGQVFRTVAGPATLTLLLQNRVEKVPAFKSTFSDDVVEPETFVTNYAKRTNGTLSAYAELDAPLISRDASMPLLKGLELQLAVRHDHQKFGFPSNLAADDPQNRLHATFAGTSYTAGAKFYPLPWLMLRASYATGRQPPPLEDLAEADIPENLLFFADPKRGNAIFVDDTDYVLKLSGSPDLKTVHASTLALGTVINPNGDGGPRVSIDFSHNRRTGDFEELSDSIVLAHEDMWPERVRREPLTDEDRARGFTGGRITVIDARGLNAGRLDVESIDAQFDWRVPFAEGTLRLYASVTRQLVNRKEDLFATPVELAGLRDGPLKWRANGGTEWAFERSMIGANLQYFGHYRIADSGTLSASDLLEEEQGSKYVKAQTYIDLYASRSFPIRWGGTEHELNLDLAIINLFDHAPPYQSADPLVGPLYSLYGDPRQRRFELTLNASF
ncbi:TonB-dependent receptor domain-containing protein [Rhizorhabdus argentea]|uniref:TonB-dependent receptor domain-containing protein n=1 Tax=Rhizorhabdus argentea TaxID=1387174 RepID=UPI0030EC26E5